MDEILNGRTVLVVDDTAVNRMLAADVLKGAGMTVVEADSGETALQTAQAGGIDAFLLDVRMGDMNGIELATLIKQRKRSQHVPILFLTAPNVWNTIRWGISHHSRSHFPAQPESQ